MQLFLKVFQFLPVLILPEGEAVSRATVALNRNLEKIEEANKVYISNQGATLWQKKINLKNRNVAA
ncbi:hypothetical protein SAMN05720469_1251, partial [Fibrobacter intestinalis]